ncbi:MAG TPA: transporter substrate-binding domain-containing protein [Fastidiosipila sp.]|nr:transporter substrate-binding domain-containing protein [Fastidiosipila sp.]
MRRTLPLFLLALLLLLSACTAGTNQTTASLTTDAPTETPADTASTESNEAAGEPFRVGMEAGYPPFNWSQLDDQNGAFKIDGSVEYAGGYDVEMAKLIAAGLNRPLVIVKTEWDGLGPAVISGKIDAIIAGMSPTGERKETLDFTDNYYESEFVIIVRKDGEYANATSIEDFAGAKLSAQLNTNHYPVIDQIEGVSKQDAMDSFASLRMALASGKIDGYVSERPEGNSVEAAMPELKMIRFAEGKGFEVEPSDIVVAVAVKKDSPLVAEINAVLQTISLETREQLMEDAIQNQPIAGD